MVPMTFSLPFAALEVGQHLYWKLGNLKIHGQVFLSSWVVIGALLALVAYGTRRMQREPSGVQNLLEYLWTYIRDLAREQIGEKAYRDWLPFIGTLFLFIFVSNWGGALIPWKLIHLPSGELGAPTADINTTIALALLVSLAYFYAGLSRKGWKYFEYYVEPTPLCCPSKLLKTLQSPFHYPFVFSETYLLTNSLLLYWLSWCLWSSPTGHVPRSVHQRHSGSDLRHSGFLLHRRGGARRAPLI